ncbi:MAG: hypothetical protein WBX16_25235, partial [Candidatus Acidiferrales bacterium]
GWLKLSVAPVELRIRERGSEWALPLPKVFEASRRSLLSTASRAKRQKTAFGFAFALSFFCIYIAE